MTIIVISVSDDSNPIEVQTWLNENPNVKIIFMAVKENKFYIVYI
jgi:hypothetical protein